MPGSRTPGPLGQNPDGQSLDDGTTVRRLSPRPGPIGKQDHLLSWSPDKPAENPSTEQPRSDSAPEMNLPTLKLRSQGPNVRLLQRQLNVRLTPSPQLEIDGVFGPPMHQLVLQYQRGLSIAADGIVNNTTWYHLLKGDQVTIPPAAGPGPPLSTDAVTRGIAAVPPSILVSLPAPPGDVWEWPLEKKFAAVLERTAPKLDGAIREEFMALASPTNVTIMAGIMVVWAGAHFFGAGEAIDLALAAFLVASIGWNAGRVLIDLGKFLYITCTAEKPEDLEEAAGHLAHAIGLLTVTAFVALLGKVGAEVGKGGPPSPMLEPVPVGPRIPPQAPPTVAKPYTPPLAYPSTSTSGGGGSGKEEPPDKEEAERKRRVADNQAKQEKLIQNQQKELKDAIDRGGAEEKGRVLDEQGKRSESITRDTLEQVKGASVRPDVKIGTGEGSVIDNVVSRGGKTVYVENKLTIAETNTRMVNQLTNATKAAQPGDSVILQVARPPTAKEITNLRNALGSEVSSKVQIVSSQTDLFNAVNAALK